MINSSLTVRIRQLCPKISCSQMVSLSEQVCVEDAHASFTCTLFSALVSLCDEGTSGYRRYPSIAKGCPELIEDVIHFRFGDLT